MKKYLLLTPLLAGLATPAYATANLACFVDDKDARIDVDGIMGMDDWAPVENLKASVFVPSETIAEAYWQVDLDKDMIQRWIIGDAINLHFHHDVTDKHAEVTVDLQIETKLDADSENQDYNGVYRLFYSLEPKGKKSFVKPTDLKTDGKIVCHLQ